MCIRTILCLAAVLFAAACAHKYETESFSAPETQIASSANALILTPQDGQYDGKPYRNSGRMVADQVEFATSVHLSRATVLASDDVASGLDEAKSGEFDYLIEPKILHWEDRATEWSGKPDRIAIKLVVWDVATGEIVSTSLERASSRWATFGGDHPQDLLPALLEVWATKVF